MDACRVCHARLFAGAAYCARCFAPVTPSEEEVAEAVVDVAAAGGRWRQPRPATDRWSPDVVHTAPAPPAIHSRWRAGVLSFSVPTKLAITFVVALGVPFVCWEFASTLAIGPIAIWSIIVTPRVLRDLWKRTRIR